MKIYKAKRTGFINYLLIASIIFPIAIFLFNRNTFSEQAFILLPLLVPMILLVWIYLDTSYSIENEELKYRSGFLRGKIEISTIKEIQKGKTKWIGVKPALANNGLIVLFNRFDEIYIAPENNEEMVSDLLKINSGIKITG